MCRKGRPSQRRGGLFSRLFPQLMLGAYRASLVSQLENTYIVEPDGTKHKLGKKP